MKMIQKKPTRSGQIKCQFDKLNFFQARGDGQAVLKKKH
jgi:hypothetical protein